MFFDRKLEKQTSGDDRRVEIPSSVETVSRSNTDIRNNQSILSNNQKGKYLDEPGWNNIIIGIRTILPIEKCEGWINDIRLIKLETGKAIIGGFPHDVFRYDVKHNHDPLFRKLFNKEFTEYGNFYKKSIEYQKEI